MRLFKKFRSARVVDGYRTYIEYWSQNPITGKLERFRETYGLNRIHDKKERLERAEELKDQINFRLPQGFPFKQETAKDRIDGQKLMDGIDFAYKLKCQTDSLASLRTYKSTHKLFTQWIERKGYQSMLLFEFEFKHAREYMDYWILEKNVSNNTYNGKRVRIMSMFQELVDREFIEVNPFSKIKRKKKTKKIREVFDKREMQLISTYYKKNKPWMYKAMLLQFYCFIRPVELRRLKFHHFDLENGLIRFKGKDTKNNDDGTITIPKAILKDFINKEFAYHPSNLFVFGSGLSPSTKQCGEGSMNALHDRVMDKLKVNRPEISWYSWKDTGMTILSEKLTPRELQKQARHSDLSITEVYLHNNGKAIQGVKDITERYV